MLQKQETNVIRGRKVATVSIIVTSYSLSRLNDIRDLLRSIRNQTEENYELVYVTERDMNLQRTVAREAQGVGLAACVIHNEGNPGLAEARNLGARAATGEILGFVDDDVILDRGWSKSVEETFKRYPRVVGITGPALPLWVGEPAEWFPKELDWLIGCTKWFDSNVMTEVSNCWGMNMAFRRTALLNAGGFSVESTEGSRYLRPGSELSVGQNLGPKHGMMAEDVEASLRVSGTTGGVLCYVPEMKVYNKVYQYRISTQYVIRRSSWIGYTRRNVSQAVNRKNSSLRFEGAILLRTLRLLIDPRTGQQPTISGFMNRYRILLLTLSSLLIGYFVGPL